ncbi:hypothetical protein QTP88_029190 [Uroleucon formosanum]
MYKNKKKKIAIICAMAIVAHETSKKKKNRKTWVKKWIEQRSEQSNVTLLKDLKENNPDDFKNYLRMDETDFTNLLELVAHRLKKQDTVMRKSISPAERLIATLRFLSTGNSYEDLKFSTKIAAQTLGHIIPETCLALYDVLKDKYMKVKYLIFIIITIKLPR